MKRWEILKHYIQDRYLVFLVMIAFFLIYSSVYFVYNIESDAVIYATYLALLVLFLFIAMDLYAYYKKHLHLRLMKANILYSEDFPKKRTLLEEDYVALVQELKKINHENTGISKEQFQEMEDYFTLWVHQMKLPISAMKLLLETEAIPDKRLLKSELLRINQYSDMVLAYLRMRSEDSDYIFKTYELDDLIRQAIRKFSTEFIRKKIKIAFEETNMQVLTDEKWLVFVLEQLLSNAIKYTKEGSVHIYGNGSTLYIEDTGIGIDPSDLPRVFEKGFTGINGHRDKKASGIGLYLCKSILNKLSHNIEIHSQVNKGTKVILHLDHYDLKVE